MSPNAYIKAAVSKVPPGVLVLAAVAGFWVCSHGMTAGPTSITGYGEERVHHVGALQPGRLLSVKATLGRFVQEGEVVAALDSRVLELEKARLVATLDRARAQLRAEEDMQSAALQRGQLQAVRTHAAEERSRAELHELDLQVKRMEGLASEHLIRADQLEEARRRQRTVAADLMARPTGTPRELELMGLRPRPQDDQSSRLEQRLAPYRAAVQVEEAALRQVENSLAEMTLRAPISGTVGAILQQPGDVVSVGAPIVTIITMRPGHVVAFVPERQLRSLDVGSAVRLHRHGSWAGSLRGHVAELAPMVEETPPRGWPSPSLPVWARRVVIELDEPAPILPGEVFRVSTR